MLCHHAALYTAQNYRIETSFTSQWEQSHFKLATRTLNTKGPPLTSVWLRGSGFAAEASASLHSLAVRASQQCSVGRTLHAGRERPCRNSSAATTLVLH